MFKLSMTGGGHVKMVTIVSLHKEDVRCGAVGQVL